MSVTVCSREFWHCQNSAFSDVQGRTFLDEDGGGSIQQRVSQEKNSNQYGLPLELFLTIDKVLLTILPYCCGVLIKHTRKKPPALLRGGGSLSDL